MLDEASKTELTDEIDRQWEYHLLTRAVFNSNFPKDLEYISPPFYEERGICIKVKILDAYSEVFKNSAGTVAVWLNQNYVIRLYGILDSKRLIKHGKENDIKIIELINIMRQNVGAHSTGRRASNKSDLNKATKLINELFGKKISIESIRSYTLSIDSVLEPMKDQVKAFISGLKAC
ncbi:MAG: hypothetical protein KDD36_02430 [Flavobacteriales bacterium]|nr:hypothetical protein [Flavobacteriales bacterium]